MQNKRLILAGAACLVSMLAATQAGALMIAPPPTILRAASADFVLVGKVTGYGPKMVKAEMFKGDTREMQIAIVKVGDALIGKGEKEIKVGFFPPMAQTGGPRISRPGVQLKQGEESLLFLKKHPTQKGVYMVGGIFDALPKANNPNFDKDVEQVKKAAKLMAKPTDGLKSKDADDRLLTSALLISRYRTPRGSQKTEEVSADESKLILEVLAEADWAKANPKLGFMTNPQGLFFQLGVTKEEGWNQPKDFQKIQAEAKKWCKDNAGKYRIKRFVAEEKKEDK